MSLIALQRSFCSDLRARPSDLESRLSGNAHVGQTVYRNAYRLRLRDCLRETYEKTWAWLGDARFDAAVELHIAHHEPHRWTLADYGEGFSQTLAAAHKDAPEAIDLASLEWAMRRAFDGPDAPPLKRQSCATIDWETAVLQFAPTVLIVPTSTNCGAIWSAIAEEQAPPEAALLPSPAALCVWRKGLSPSFRTVERLELAMIRLALAGVRFGEICRLITHFRDEADPVAELGALFARWLNDELLAEFPAESADQLSVTCNSSEVLAELVNANQAKSEFKGEPT